MSREGRSLAGLVLLAVVLGGAVLVLRGRHEKAPSPSLPVAGSRDPILESDPTEAAYPPAPVAREATREPAAASEPAPEERPASKAMGALKVGVIDAWDRPVESAEIRARRTDLPGTKATTLRIGEGTLSLPLGVPHRLEVVADGCYDPVAQEPVYADGREVTVRLVSQCARISGRLVDAETGQPVRYAHVAYKAEGANGAAGRPGGGFDLLVPAGELRLDVGAAEREPSSRVFRLESGEWLRDVEIPLTSAVPNKSVVEGRVMDPEGVPVDGAKVMFGAVTGVRTEMASATTREKLGEMVTDVSGGFEVSVPTGTTVLHVEAAGFEPSGPISFEVHAGREVVDVTLARGGRLRIRGVLADGSASAPTEVTVRREAEVMLRVRSGYVDRAILRAKVSGSAKAYSMGRESLVSERAAADDEKYVTIEGVPHGEYLVVVTAGDLQGEAMAFVPVVGTVVVDVPVAEPRGRK